MTNQHFIWFAARMKADLAAGQRFDAAEQKRTRDAVLYAATTFADLATNYNRTFDRARFMEACGL